MMESMLLHFKQLSGLNLASREIVSLIERLSVSSFTGDNKIPYTIWKQLGILSGLQQRGFPHVNQSVLDLWSRALRGQYWLSNTGDNRPVTFSHLRAIRYHYGDLIWAQCTMQSRLELFLSIQGVHASGVSIGECIRVVSAIIADQFVPEVCRSIASYWDRIYLENVKRAHVFERQINAHFEEWGVPLLASGENSSGRSDQDCLEAYFVENVDNSELDDGWIQKQCDNVAAYRDQFTRTLLDLRSQKAVVDAIANGGKLLRRGHTSSSAAAAAGSKSSETPIALGHEIKTELDEAFPLNKNSSRDKLSLKRYSESMSVLAFTGRANAQSNDREDIHESSCIRNLFLKGMTWQSSLQQLVRFCQRSATDEKGGITPVFLAATIEEVLISNGIYFVMGYYQNRLTASRSMILTRQESLGPPGVQGHEANVSSMQAPKKNQGMLGHVESRFGIKLSESTLPEDLQLGKKGLLDDLAKNPRQESQEMFWRVSRIFQGLDLGDYRHFHLVLVAQILFLHTPPPEVLVKSNLQYTFTKNRPNSRNTKWLAAFVVFGLMRMHEDELMKMTCAREGDPKNLMTKIGKYNITARLMLRAGLFDDCGLSGDLKNFNQWRFVSLSRSEQEVARIRHAATEGPLIFLMTVWPRDVAEYLAS
nr:hypothetical protein CFP56_77846 [Quercus suber]